MKVYGTSILQIGQGANANLQMSIRWIRASSIALLTLKFFSEMFNQRAKIGSLNWRIFCFSL